MSERAVFDTWFTESFGHRPKGNREEIKTQIIILQEQLQKITEWDCQYKGALTAWHEKHNRDLKS